VLLIKTKDFRTLAIKLLKEEDQKKFEEELRKLAFPDFEDDDVAFMNFKYECQNYFKAEKKDSPSKLEPKVIDYSLVMSHKLHPQLVEKILKDTPLDRDGWDVYSFEEEFERQGVTEDGELFKVYESWSEGHAEDNTYPSKVFVPRNISHSDVAECAKFRTRKRFPALSYFYRNIGTSLWRCSQNKTGFLFTRSTEDERMISHIANTYNNLDELIIVDARSYLSAQANKVKGGGFEHGDFYSNTQVRKFLDHL